MKQRKSKKKGFWYYLYAVVILFLTNANIALSVLLLTHVQNIEVDGTKYSKQGAIVEWFQEDTFTKNSLYSLWKIKTGAYELPVYLDKIDIRFNALWDICLEVEEKEIIAGVCINNTYVYFDKEGLVMTIEQEPLDGYVMIEGILSNQEQEIQIKQFEKLEIEEEHVFEIIYKFVKSLEKQNLSPDKIVWDNGSMNLMFDQIKVLLGRNNFDDKLAQIPPIMEGEELQGKAGTLYLENYNEVGDSITFKPEVTEAASENEEQQE